jgi:hypothetical protein
MRGSESDKPFVATSQNEVSVTRFTCYRLVLNVSATPQHLPFKRRFSLL